MLSAQGYLQNDFTQDIGNEDKSINLEYWKRNEETQERMPLMPGEQLPLGWKPLFLIKSRCINDEKGGHYDKYIEANRYGLPLKELAAKHWKRLRRF